MRQSSTWYLSKEDLYQVGFIWQHQVCQLIQRQFWHGSTTNRGKQLNIIHRHTAATDISAAIIFWEFDIRRSFVLVRFVVNSIDKHNPKYYTMWLENQTSSCYAFKTLGHAALPVSTSISNYSTRIQLKTIRQLRSSMAQFSAENATKTFAQTHCQTLATVVCHLAARNGDWTGRTEV